MSILDNAINHYKSKLDGGLLSLEVPEWNATIHFKAALSLKERDPIYQAMRSGSLEAFADALMVRALDADGKILFKKHQRNDLLSKVDPDVMIRVINEIAERSSTSIEEAEKN